MEDDNKLDVCEVNDNTVADGQHQADSDNQWQLPDTKNSPSCFNEGQPVKEPLPIETSISLNVGGEKIKESTVDVAETGFSQEDEVGNMFIVSDHN